jgi:hypothetical protein
MCFVTQNAAEIGKTVATVVGECVVGAAAGEEAIGGPLGLGVATILNPDAAVLLPAGGCVVGAVAGAIEVASGYEGPSPVESPVPQGP